MSDDFFKGVEKWGDAIGQAFTMGKDVNWGTVEGGLTHHAPDDYVSAWANAAHVATQITNSPDFTFGGSTAGGIPDYSSYGGDYAGYTDLPLTYDFQESYDRAYVSPGSSPSYAPYYGPEGSGSSEGSWIETIFALVIVLGLPLAVIIAIGGVELVLGLLLMAFVGAIFGLGSR